MPSTLLPYTQRTPMPSYWRANSGGSFGPLGSLVPRTKNSLCEGSRRWRGRRLHLFCGIIPEAASLGGWAWLLPFLTLSPAQWVWSFYHQWIVNLWWGKHKHHTRDQKVSPLLLSHFSWEEPSVRWNAASIPHLCTLHSGSWQDETLRELRWAKRGPRMWERPVVGLTRWPDY